MSGATTTSRRVHYLDTLKVAVVYGIVLYHATLPFSWTGWLVSNTQKSMVLTVLAGFCFPWGIPMMFFLAGADSWFALRSRSALAFARARFLRLVLPLAGGIALLSPLQWYLIRVPGDQWSLAGLAHAYPDFVGVIPHAVTPLWLGRVGYQLWFLGYLFAISLAALPLLLLLREDTGRRWVAAAAAWSRRPGRVLVAAVPLIASQLLLRQRFPAYQDWADVATYALVFLAGAVFASDRSLEDGVRASVRPALLAGSLSAIGVGAHAWLIAPRLDLGAFRPAEELLYDCLWAVMIWSWIVAVLNLGMRWLDFGNRAVDYLAESILPVYVISHPLVVITACIVVPLPLGVWPKFAFVALTSLTTTVAIYEFGVRRWGPTRLLFGLKRRPRGPGSAAAPPAAPELLPGTTAP